MRLRNLAFVMILLVLAGIFALWGLAADTVYEWRIQAVDHAGNLSAFSEPWMFSVDETDPYIYFTGATPLDGTYSSETTFTGQIEAIESRLRKLTRTRDATDYIFDMTGHATSFGTGDYSLTDYTDTGLVLAMNFDTSGDIQDYSTYGNDGINYNTQWTGDGRLGGAQYFTGADQYIQVSEDINFENKAFTLSTWIKPIGPTTGGSHIVSPHAYAHVMRHAGGYNAGRRALYGNMDNSISFRKGGPEMEDKCAIGSSASSVQIGQWTHVLSTWDGNELKVYINGTENNSVSCTSEYYTGVSTEIGRAREYDQFNGYMDDIRIYNYAFTSGQISQLYTTTITKYDDVLRGIDTIQTGLAEGTYTYSAMAEDIVGHTGTTALRTYTVDSTAPVIYFTGMTPADGTMSTNTTFTGEVETIETNLSGLVWNWDGTRYSYSLKGQLYSEGFFSASGVEANGGVNHSVVYDSGLAIFNGTNSYISTEPIQDAEIFTIRTRVRFTSLNFIQYPFSVGSDNIDGFGISTYMSGGFSYIRILTSIQSEGNIALGSTPLEVNKDYEIVCIGNGTQWKLYLNGVEDELRVIDGANDGSNRSDFVEPVSFVTIGALERGTPGRNNYLSGSMDFIEIYDYARTSTQVTENYNKKVEYLTGNIREYTAVETNLADGSYAYQACAEDASQLTGCTDLRTYNVDTTPPLIENISPASGTVIETGTVTLTRSGSDAFSSLSGYQYELLSGGEVVLSGNRTQTGVTITQLDNVNYTWHVRAWDSVNNWSLFTDERSFTVDVPNIQVYFTGTTPPDGATLTTGDVPVVQIEIMEDESPMNQFVRNLDGESYEMYGTSLVLSMDFDNVSILGEDATIVKDVSLYGHDGVVNGATWTGAGHSNGAYYLDNGSSITIPNFDEVFSTGDMTMSIWMKVDNWTGGISNNIFNIVSYNYFRLFHRGDLAGHNLFWGYRVNEYVGVGDSSRAGRYMARSSNPIATDIRYHIVGVKQDEKLQIYVNGIKEREVNSLEGRSYYTGGVQNALYLSYNTDLAGFVDEFDIYNRALSSGEVEQLYLSDLTKTSSGQRNFEAEFPVNTSYNYSGHATDLRPTYDETETRTSTVDLGVCEGSEIPLSECEALMAIYTGTEGNNWTNNTNRMTGNPCTRYGVFCAAGHVRSLDLSSNNLGGYLTGQIEDLTQLKQLDLQSNAISDLIPSEITNLSVLEDLNLARNEFTGSIPTNIDQLQQLQRIYLYENNIGGEVPSALGSINNLLDIRLWNNQLTGEIPTELGNLENVQYLNIQYNNLTGMIPEELGTLYNLYYLYLGNNNLQGVIPSSLGDIPLLVGLGLSENNLIGTIPGELGDSNLAYLYLDNNNLEGPIPAELGNTNLRYLQLHNNNLEGPIPSELFDLDLNRLMIYNNNLVGPLPELLTTQLNLRPGVDTQLQDNCFYTGAMSTGLIDFLSGKEATREPQGGDKCIIDLSIDNHVSTPSLPSTGDEVTLDLAYYNSGQVRAYSGYLDYQLDTGMNAATNTGWIDLGSNVFRYPFGYLLNNTGGSLQFIATVQSDLPAGNDLTNTGFIDSFSIENITGNNLSTRTIDRTAPWVYFTGDTPVDGYVTTGDSFSGLAEAVEMNLSQLTRSRDTTDYIFNISGYENAFDAGDYSLTDYTDTGLVLAMNFHSSGDIQDYSLADNNGTATGDLGVLWDSNGPVGGAVHFTGVGNYLELEEPIDFPGRKFTFAGRIKPMGPFTGGRSSNTRAIVMNNYGYNKGWRLLYDVNVRGFIVQKGGTDSDRCTVSSETNTVRTDERTHITAVWDSNELVTYLDGEEYLSVSCTGDYYTGGITRIGKSAEFAAFNGYLDDIRIYDYAKTQEEISQIYATAITKYNEDTWTISSDQTNLAEGNYDYLASAQDMNKQTGATETRTYHVRHDPMVYFTGATPDDGFVSTKSTFSGTAETIEENLRKFTRNRNGTDYDFNISGHEDQFGVGDYSMIDYTDTGLILAYNFDATGDIKDYSLSQNDGTNSGAVWTSSGALGGAYIFNQEDQKIITSPVNFHNKKFTLATWINPAGNFTGAAGGDSGNSRANILVNVGYTVGWRLQYYDRENTIMLEKGGDTAENRCLLQTPAIDELRLGYNEWHHIVAKRDTQKLYLYINGKEYASMNCSSDYFTGGTTYIGKSTEYAAFSGYIDDIHIRNYDLTEEEIYAMYNTTVKKYSNNLRGLDFGKTNLPDATYTYQSCVEDSYGLSACTETRSYEVNTIKTLTVSSIPTFRDRIGDYSSTGDMWIFVQSGSTRTQVYNSSKNATQTGVSVGASGTGQVVFSGGIIQSGDVYLAMYKPTGGLSIGYTGIWTDTITGFDFTITNPNLYPKMEYNGVTYTKLGDVEDSSSARRDYINEFDLTEINYNLNQSNGAEIYDFDGNNTTNVIEQSAVIQFDNQRGCIEQFTEIEPLTGLQKTDFY